MKTNTLERIVELWPSLPETARATIVDIAESASPREMELDLTPEDERLIEQSREDFRQGRTLTLEQYRTEMDTFMAELAVQAKR
jgi:hypothetical protein